MNKKLTIWIIVLFCLSSSVFAFNTSLVRHLWFESQEGLNGTGYEPYNLSGSTMTQVAGKVGYGSQSNNDKRFDWAVSSYNLSELNNEWSYCWWLNMTSIGNNGAIIDGGDAGDIIAYTFFLTNNLWYSQDVGETTFNFGSGTALAWDHYCLVQDLINITGYKNSVKVGSSEASRMTISDGTGTVHIQNNDANNLGIIGIVNQLAIFGDKLTPTQVVEIYNSTVGISLTPVAAAPTNLSIDNSTYNMTSDGGCTNWTQIPLGETMCLTTDGTPTVTFDTNYDASCSLRSVAQIVYNSSFICGTTTGTSHVCTIFDSDKLLFGTDDLTIACSGVNSDSSPKNVTSPNLNINMTAGGGGAGLVSCINVIGSGCGAVITNNCAAIIS